MHMSVISLPVVSPGYIQPLLPLTSPSNSVEPLAHFLLNIAPTEVLLSIFAYFSRCTLHRLVKHGRSRRLVGIAAELLWRIRILYGRSAFSEFVALIHKPNLTFPYACFIERLNIHCLRRRYDPDARPHGTYTIVEEDRLYVPSIDFGIAIKSLSGLKHLELDLNTAQYFLSKFDLPFDLLPLHCPVLESLHLQNYRTSARHSHTLESFARKLCPSTNTLCSLHLIGISSTLAGHELLTTVAQASPQLVSLIWRPLRPPASTLSQEINDLTDDTVTAIATHCPRLQTLQVMAPLHNPKLTDAGLLALAKGCRSLKNVTIVHWGVTFRGVEKAVARMKDLDRIYCEGMLPLTDLDDRKRSYRIARKCAWRERVSPAFEGDGEEENHDFFGLNII